MEDNKPDLTFVTIDELLDELKSRFKMCIFFGELPDGDDFDTRASYKVENNHYEVLGLLSAADLHFKTALFSPHIASEE